MKSATIYIWLTMNVLFLLLCICYTEGSKILTSTANLKRTLNKPNYSQNASVPVTTTSSYDSNSSSIEGRSSKITPCSYKCSCGVSASTDRIVNGDSVDPYLYPWMVAIYARNKPYCAGSLINSRYVLTAAHCVNTVSDPRKLHGFLLKYDLINDSEETYNIRVNFDLIILHPRFDVWTFNNDITLLRTEAQITMNDILHPVCLPEYKMAYEGYQAIVAGWGKTSYNGKSSGKLLQIIVPIYSHEQCRKTSLSDFITPNMMCAGYPDGKKDACQGDSGGPLHVLSKTTFRLTIAGVVSFGDDCAQPNSPGTYTRVSNYVDWIESNTKDACYCME